MTLLVGSAYLDWITDNFSKARHNLAASGTPALGMDEIAAITPMWSAEPATALAVDIAHLYGLNPAEVLACNGASQALWLAYAVSLKPGDEALVETPAYAPFSDIVPLLGGRLRRFERGNAQNAALDAERICAMLSPATRVVALSHLHNPTGKAADPHAIARIAHRLERQGGFVILNEIYADFHGTGSARQIAPGKSGRGLADNVITVSSMSKAYGLGALRVGWIAAPEHLIRSARSALLASTGELSPAWAATARGALAELPRLGRRAATDLDRKRQMIEAWIASHPDLAWSDPDGGLFGLLGLPPGVDDMAIAGRAITEFDLIVAPGSFFGRPSSVRLAWSCGIEILEAGLDRLSRLLETHIATNPDIF